MQLTTENNFAGFAADHPWSAQFAVLSYADGAFSTLPHRFFRDWLEEEPGFGNFCIGRCSGFGVESFVKYDSDRQRLSVGRFVAGGARLRFVLNGQHDMRTISTYMFSVQGNGLKSVLPPQLGDTVIRNDVWIGDEAMVLGGAVIENGCVIGARTLVPQNFRTEPYGVYAGTPARLIRYRFSEPVRAALLALAWWEMPLAWIQANNAMFVEDLSTDDTKALLVLDILRRSRDQWQAEHGAAVPPPTLPEATP